MSLELKQSAPLTYMLSATGGVLEVFATALLAIVDAREKQGYNVTMHTKRAAFVGNVIFQILASLAGNLFATWFGPISIVAPIFFSAQLVANMIIFGFLLGLEVFSKDMEIGTYVIVLASVLLPNVGPDIQEDQNISELLSRWYAILWLVVLIVAMIGSACILMLCNITKKIRKEWIRMIILLLARSSSFALNLTVSRAMILEPQLFVLILSIVIKIVSGAVYAYAIIVQSTAVKQSKFVPLNAVSIMLTIAITGIIIWEDYKVIHNWVGYVCVFLLFCMGSYLLLSTGAPLMTSSNPEYGTVNHIRQSVRNFGLPVGSEGETDNVAPQAISLSSIQEESWEEGTEDEEKKSTPTPHRGSFLKRRQCASFRDAWKDVLHTDERLQDARKSVGLFIPHHHHQFDSAASTSNATPTSSDVRQRRLNNTRPFQSLYHGSNPHNEQQSHDNNNDNNIRVNDQRASLSSPIHRNDIEQQPKKSKSLDPNTLSQCVDRAHTELAPHYHDDNDDGEDRRQQQHEDPAHDPNKEDEEE